MNRWPVRVAAILLAQASLMAAQNPATNSVLVTVQATLGADGSLHGTVKSTWSGACAVDLRARLQKTKPGEIASLLNAFASASLAGHLKPEGAIAGLDTPGSDLTVSYTLDAPKFAATGAGRSLLLGLPLLQPYDPRKVPGSSLPVSIDHDLSIKLPAGMVPLEFPPVFSTVTPNAGRYVLYHDLERSGDVVLKVRRELEIVGPPSAALNELLDGAAAHDAPSLTLIVAPAKPPSR